MFHTGKKVHWKDKEEDRKGVPMEHQWLCGGGVVHRRVHGRGKTLPKWVIEQKFARLTIKRELLSEEDLMFEDAEAREQDMKF